MRTERRTILPFRKRKRIPLPLQRQIAKSADKKITPKTQEQYNIILENMKENEWYKSRDFCDILGVKETRVKELFRGLSKDGKIIDNDKTKGRMYKKI